MIDRKGKVVTLGAACRFKPAIRDEWLPGTVRAIHGDETEARVDDGDPARDIFDDNGFHVSAWVDPPHIEIVEKA